MLSSELTDSGGAIRFSIYSPYVMLNKTGLDMFFKAKSLIHSAREVAGQQAENRRGKTVKPFMFSYGKYEPRNRALIKIGRSEWSRPLSFEALGSIFEVVVPSDNQNEEIHVGVGVDQGSGKYSLTKVVTFTPRFVVHNKLDQDILFREPGSPHKVTLASRQRAPLHFLRKVPEKQLTIAYSSGQANWSSPFNIQSIGKVHTSDRKKTERRPDSRRTRS